MKEITKPLIILNFKINPEVFGEKGMQIAKIAEKISENLGITIVLCPPIVYLAKCAEIFNIPVFSQRVDNIKNGNITGKVSVDMLTESGASGSLINHTDNLMNLDNLETVIRLSRTLRLFTTVCTSNEAISAAVTKLDPNAIAFESNEFNKTDRSEAKFNKEFIENHVKRIRMENPRITPIYATDVYPQNNLKKAIELGIEGILIESTLIKAKDPYESLNGIAKCFITNT
jgi:triosephosphate isomerase